MTTLPLNEQFVLAEDEALKTKLTGLTIPAPRGAGGEVGVGVWYRWPTPEYGDKLFPFITIDTLTPQFDRERAHSYNYDQMDYIPDTEPDAATPISYTAPFPVPMTIPYLVVAHTRSARHDRELLRLLLQPGLLPWRFGFVDVDVDNTRRRLDLLSLEADADIDSLSKRVFRRIFTIGISAEVLPERPSLTQLVENVIFDSETSPDVELEPPFFTIS